MTTIKNLNLSNTTNFNLSFLVNMGASRWIFGNEKVANNFLTKEFRNKIPKNDIFEINSLFFNIMKHKKEILNKYKCYFDEENNQFCLILDEKVCFSDFTKEIMLNLFEFSEKLGIDTICFLVSKKNPQFVRIMQDLMIVGFKSNEKNKETFIEGDIYKIMEIPVNINEKIEEFYF